MQKIQTGLERHGQAISDDYTDLKQSIQDFAFHKTLHFYFHNQPSTFLSAFRDFQKRKVHRLTMSNKELKRTMLSTLWLEQSLYISLLKI